mgnify:CR=1 FL=1
MREIKPDAYGPAARELISKAFSEQRPSTLLFGSPSPEALPALRGMTDQTISNNRRVRMPFDAQALHAALWLLFDYMKESHDISQNIATPSGSYWHAILHRREGDAGNAKYWVARVGDHPIFPEMLADAQDIAAGAGAAGRMLAGDLQNMTTWNEGWLVDRCATPADPATTKVLLQLQQRQWQLLFDYNYKKAFA